MQFLSGETYHFLSVLFVGGYFLVSVRYINERLDRFSLHTQHENLVESDVARRNGHGSR